MDPDTVRLYAEDARRLIGKLRPLASEPFSAAVSTEVFRTPDRHSP
jgi:hypothetical protein